MAGQADEIDGHVSRWMGNDAELGGRGGQGGGKVDWN